MESIKDGTNDTIPVEREECMSVTPVWAEGIVKHATTVKIAMIEVNEVPRTSTWIPSQREITIKDFAFRVYNDSTHLISNSKPISSSRWASQYHQSNCPKKCYTYLFSISTSFSLSTQCSVLPYAWMVGMWNGIWNGINLLLEHKSCNLKTYLIVSIPEYIEQC